MIKLYSSHCPMCVVVENILKQKNINYEVCDDEKEYLPIAEQSGIKSMPFADVNGKMMKGKELIDMIKNGGIK